MLSGRNSTRDKDMATADDLEEIKISLNFMSGELTKLTSQQERLIGLVEEVKTLKAMLIEKDRKIIVLEQRVDELEQYTKRDNLVLTGWKLDTAPMLELLQTWRQQRMHHGKNC